MFRLPANPTLRLAATLRRPQRLVWAGLLLTIVMVLALTAAALWQSRQQHLARAEVQSQALATLTDAYLAAHVEAIDHTLMAAVTEMQDQLAQGRLDAARATAHLRVEVAARDELQDLQVTDSAGVGIVGPGLQGGTPTDFSEHEAFRALRHPLDPGLHVSRPLKSPVNGEWSLTFARRYLTPDGGFGGVVLAAVPLDYFARLLSRVDTGPDGVVVLRDRQLRQIVRSPPLAGPRGEPGTDNAVRELRARLDDPTWGQTSYRSQGATDGVTRTLTAHRLASAPLLVVVGVSDAHQLAGWWRDVRAASAVAVVVVLLWAAGGVALLRALARGQAARQRAHLLAQVFEHSGESILVTDRENRIVEVNPAFVAQTGYAPHEVLGRDPQLLASGQTSPEDYASMWATLSRTGQWRGELHDRAKDGTVAPKWVSISVVRDEAGQVTHHIAHTMDLSAQKATEARILQLAHHDALTGLPNRALLPGRLEQALASARRDNTELVMLFIDLDRFKDINDSLGHHVGDALLIEVARRLQGLVRDSDILARLGGDEFVLVLTGVGQEGVRAGTAVARKALEALSQPYQVGGHELHSSSSIGLSVFPGDGWDADTLMKGADSAMYHAKAAGRNTFHFFTAAMNEASIERLALEQGLRVAVERGELFLQYQPQVNVASGRVVGVEALARWRHPTRGLVPPFKFIPIAEETGLIGAIGQWVLDESLAQVARWRAAGLGALRVAVNLSAHQLRDEQFSRAVAAGLLRHGLPGSALELEVTESTAMRDPARTAQQLRQLRDLGVALAIDDFGTGYSSLAYLKQLPLSCLKLDRSFVMDIENDPNDAAISAATITLAHSLGLAVVAEGVENEAQLSFLRGLNCDLVQGYHFSRPLDAADCQAFIERLGAPVP